MTSYLATATKQDGALCHGFVKKLFMVVFFCISFLLLLLLFLLCIIPTRALTMHTCCSEVTAALRKCLTLPTRFSCKYPC